MEYKIVNGAITFGANTILEEINFEIKNNEKIAIVGRNGSGKTSLLKAIVDNDMLETGLGNEDVKVIKSEFKITGNNTYQTVIDSDILVIDGLGNEAITTWSRDEILLSILDNRLQSDKITILCSEFSLDDLKKLYKVNYNDEVKVNQIIEKINEIKK